MATLDATRDAAPSFDVFRECPLCGSAEARVLFRRAECGTVVRCAPCGMAYTRERPLPSFPELRRKEPVPLPDVILVKEADQERDFRDVLDGLGRFQQGGRLLELGSLTGHFLNLARAAGYDVVGIEPDTWAADYARCHFGVEVHDRYLNELGLPSGSADAIVMLHVLEHLTAPNETVLELRRILKDTGVLVIEIPIIETLLTRLMGRHHRHFVFDHTLFFTQETFARFLDRHGFRVVHQALTPRTLRLSRIAANLQRNSRALGATVDGALRAIGLADARVTFNTGDILRAYCMKSAIPSPSRP